MKFASGSITMFHDFQNNPFSASANRDGLELKIIIQMS